MAQDFNFQFEEATREAIALKMSLRGVTGGGKTWTALALATYMLGGDAKDPSMTRRIAVIDTERGSANRYAKGRPWHFSTVQLKSFEPEAYVAAIRAAERAGFEVVVIDSLSHEWSGTGGALEQVDRVAQRGNTFAAWGKVTPRHNELIDTIMGTPLHVIATLRAKMAYEQTEDKKVRKVGLAAIQRDGIEYEFDIVADMDIDNTMTIDKTRCSDLAGRQFRKPGRDVAEIIGHWLADGPPAREERQAEATLRAQIVDWQSVKSAGDFTISAGDEKGRKLSEVADLAAYRLLLEGHLANVDMAKHHDTVRSRLRAVYDMQHARGEATPLAPPV